MNIRASGRSALIIAAGLWLGFAGPMRVTDSAAEPAGQAAQTENAGAPVKLSKSTKHRSHKHHKRHAAHTRKSHKTASKEADAQADKTASATPDSDKRQDSDKHVPLPPTVANANANVEMPGAIVDAPKTEADALASDASKTLAATQAESANPQSGAAPVTASAADIVPADELNEVDRALIDDKQQPAPILAMASLDTPPSASSADTTTTTGQAVASEDSWNKASLIGKIFIAFGGLLTFASAARMFMA
jgi:hypothetical protein